MKGVCEEVRGVAGRMADRCVQLKAMLLVSLLQAAAAPGRRHNAGCLHTCCRERGWRAVAADPTWWLSCRCLSTPHGQRLQPGSQGAAWRQVPTSHSTRQPVQQQENRCSSRHAPAAWSQKSRGAAGASPAPGWCCGTALERPPHACRAAEQTTEGKQLIKLSDGTAAHCPDRAS